jgi:hypothetical protein
MVLTGFADIFGVDEMKTEKIAKNGNGVAMNLDPAEKKVYSSALQSFSRGETYRNTPDPLRTSLQRDYAQFMVECYQREKRNNRSHALRF